MGLSLEQYLKDMITEGYAAVEIRAVSHSDGTKRFFVGPVNGNQERELTFTGGSEVELGERKLRGNEAKEVEEKKEEVKAPVDNHGDPVKAELKSAPVVEQKASEQKQDKK